VNETIAAPAPVATESHPRTRTRACPVCGETRAEPFLKHDGWRVVHCTACGLYYMPEVPTDEEFDTTFEWDASFKREKFERWMRNPFFRAYTLAAALLRPTRQARAMHKLRRFAPPPGKLLDVGCGDGRLPAHALSLGYDAWGIEASPRMAARASERIDRGRIYVGRLSDLSTPGVDEAPPALAPRSFDVVVTVSYIEHEPDPAPAMRQVFSLLKPGGWCAQKTPNHDSWLRTIRGSHWAGYRWPEHVQYFTPETLGRLMRDCGFIVRGVNANRLGDNFWLFAQKPSAESSDK
jgi:SAM-dependent methyltransferase